VQRIAALQPARFALVLSAVFRTTPALPSSQTNSFHNCSGCEHTRVPVIWLWRHLYKWKGVRA
jgi:hypothetical protein